MSAKLRMDAHVHRLGEELDLPYALKRSVAWWLAAELIRRHPEQLRVIETHPGGGQYDCISLYERGPDPAKLFAHLNLLGRIAHGSWFEEDSEAARFNWLDVLAAEDPIKDIIGQLERVGGLSSPKATPATTKRSIGPRLLSRFATSASLTSRTWLILNAMCDSSEGSGIQEWTDQIPGVPFTAISGDLLGEPAYRYWFVLDHERRPFTAVDVDFGIAWRCDGAGDSIDLMATYAANGRRIDAVLRAAFPYVE